MTYLFLILSTLAWLLIPSTIAAQAEPSFANFSTRSLTPDDGLSQGSNYFRHEDKLGFMWITANDALNRYDGKMVKVYNLNQYFSNCPNLQQGYGFAEDEESNIYIGSVRGLYIYHRKNDHFTLQKIFTNAPDEVAMPFGYKDGKIWCFNRQWQIATYEVATQIVEILTKVNLKPIASVHVYQLEGISFYNRFPFFDKLGNCWLVGNEEVACYNPAIKTTTFLLGAYLSNRNIMSAAYDSSNHHLLLGTSNGLLSYSINTKKLLNLPAIAGKPLASIESLCINDQMIAIKSANGIVLTNKNFTNPYWQDFKGFKSYWRSYCYAFDKSGRLWICDDGFGQVVFNFRPTLLGKVPQENNNLRISKQLIDRGVGKLAEMPNGDILINIFAIQNKLDGRLQASTIAISDSLHSSFSTDKYRKGIWFATNSSGTNSKAIIYFLEKNNKLTLLYSEKEKAIVGQSQDIVALPNGRVMCSFENGVYWLYPKKKTLEKIVQLTQASPFKINALSGQRVAISYLNNDMLLVKLLPNNKVEVVQKILPGIQSFYMQEDTVRKQYWLGSNKGIYLLNKDFKTIKQFDANNGLAGTYIYGLLLDDEGNAWASHQRGLSSISCVGTKQEAYTYQIINYDKSDGIQDWDFNNRAFYKASDGTLYFGGIKGFNYFKPPLKKIVYYKPEVYVDEIWVNNQRHKPDTNANLLQKLELGYTENNISIKAIVKDLSYAGIHHLIYRIKETDIKWKYLPNNSTILFNSLAAGNYTLQLGIYDKFSGKEMAQKTIYINIETPFYRRFWFLALAALLFTIIVFWLYTRRKLLNQRIAFQQQLALEQQRSKITADLHDDIGASLSSLQVNSAVAAHWLKNDITKVLVVLEKIEQQSKKIADNIGDIIWSMKPGKDEFMTIGARIKNFAHDILSATNIAYKIQIDKEVDTAVTDITTRKNIVLIAKEAINNAVKYSQATEVTVKLIINKGMLLLSIIDNGVGIPTNASVDNGNGLANMRKRTEELGGVFVIKSALGQGTQIECKIPV